MIRKIPVIGYRISLRALLSGVSAFFSGGTRDEFRDTLAGFIQCRHVYFVNSGISAFYLALLALKKISRRTEVVLPAYTAPSLVVAVRKAGLKPVLCDISLRDFNMDMQAALQLVSRQTLCIVCVHMFGIPAADVGRLKQGLPEDVFLIEDCAQAMGSEIAGRPVGGSGDLSIFSFNRGKNLPAAGGGVIFTDSGMLASAVEELVDELSVPGLGYEIRLFLWFVCLSMLFRPFFYSLLYPLVCRFRDDTLPVDFTVGGYTSLQAGLGKFLFEGLAESCRHRYENAMAVLDALGNTRGIILPCIRDDLRPAFNRLPVLIEDTESRRKVERELSDNGIGVSGLYFRPLHHIFDLGYDRSGFPNAVYLAERLLTLPSHPLLERETLEKMTSLIRKVLS
ncbi:MAG: hypothetical protein GXP46_12850 [Deferribacteres bacterium]|nr:hypothetical protein [Deferribacteres bacterium]